MKRFIIATALAVAGVVLAPVCAFAAQPLNVAVMFSPNPPRQGIETVTVVLTDEAHKAVSGAHVVVATSMPTMSMTGPSVVAAPKGKGRYVVSLRIAFSTRWAFTVTARSNGRIVSRTVTRDIK